MTTANLLNANALHSCGHLFSCDTTVPPSRASGGAGAEREGPSPAAGWKCCSHVPAGMLLPQLLIVRRDRDRSRRQRSGGAIGSWARVTPGAGSASPALGARWPRPRTYLCCPRHRLGFRGLFLRRLWREAAPSPTSHRVLALCGGVLSPFPPLPSSCPSHNHQGEL